MNVYAKEHENNAAAKAIRAAIGEKIALLAAPFFSMYISSSNEDCLTEQELAVYAAHELRAFVEYTGGGRRSLAAVIEDLLADEFEASAREWEDFFTDTGQPVEVAVAFFAALSRQVADAVTNPLHHYVAGEVFRLIWETRFAAIKRAGGKGWEEIEL